MLASAERQKPRARPAGKFRQEFYRKASVWWAQFLDPHFVCGFFVAHSRQTALPAAGLERHSDVRVCPTGKASTASPACRKNASAFLPEGKRLVGAVFRPALCVRVFYFPTGLKIDSTNIAWR